MDNDLICIIYTRPYDLIDEETGERKQGVSIHFIDQTCEADSKEDGIGYPVLKNSIDISNSKSLVTVPGYYKPIYTRKVLKGQQVVKLSNVEFVKDATIFEGIN